MAGPFIPRKTVNIFALEVYQTLRVFNMLTKSKISEARGRSSVFELLGDDLAVSRCQDGFLKLFA